MSNRGQPHPSGYQRQAAAGMNRDACAFWSKTYSRLRPPAREPCREGLFVAFERLVMHVVHAAHAALAAAVGGVWFGRALRHGVGGIVVWRFGFAGDHGITADVAARQRHPSEGADCNGEVQACPRSRATRNPARP